MLSEPIARTNFNVFFVGNTRKRYRFLGGFTSTFDRYSEPVIGSVRSYTFRVSEQEIKLHFLESLKLGKYYHSMGPSLYRSLYRSHYRDSGAILAFFKLSKPDAAVT